MGAIPPHLGKRSNLLKMARIVWMPGLDSALSCLGFGTMIAFSSLYSVERNWNPVWLLFSTFAVSLTATRLFLGHLPDRRGGAKVALASIFIEATGLTLVWLAPNQLVAVIGAFFSGQRFRACLSRPRYRSRSSCTTPEPRPGYGRLHGIPRCCARLRKSRSRPPRRLERTKLRLSGRRPFGAQRICHCASAAHPIMTISRLTGPKSTAQVRSAFVLRPCTHETGGRSSGTIVIN